MADRHAALRAAPVVPQPEDPGAELAHPRELFLRVPCWWLGQTPVDETGKPLYGDVFGTNAAEFQTKTEEEEIDRTPWGELEPSDEESSEEEEEEESDEDKPDETGFITLQTAASSLPEASRPCRQEWRPLNSLS